MHAAARKERVGICRPHAHRVGVLSLRRRWRTDSDTVSVGPANTHTFLAGGSVHRMVLGGELSGQGCNSTPRFTVVSVKAKVG